MRLEIDRLALGPRERGRGYGVIAATRGLTLPPDGLAGVEDFNLRIGDHVATGREINACFRISVPPARELWFVSTTVVHGRESGNVVWVTWGAVLDRPQMAALGARAYRLFGMLESARRPKVGEDLAPLEIDPERLPPLAGRTHREEKLAGYAVHLGTSPLQLEVFEPMAALAMLDKMMDCLTDSRREELSYADAPIPLRSWDLVAFQHEKWEGLPRYATGGAEPVRVDGAGITGGRPASIANLVWENLGNLVADRAELGGPPLERELVARRRIEVAGGGDVVTVEARLRALIDGIRKKDGESAAAERMVQLFNAASSLPDHLIKPAALAMIATWEDMFGATSRPLEWFYALQQLGTGIHRRLNLPERLLPRIAAENRLILSLDPNAADAMGELLTTIFSAPLLEQSVHSSEGKAETALALLARLVPRLGATAPEQRGDWDLANQLCRRALRLADDPANLQSPGERQRISKILIEFLETVVRMRRADGIETMFQPESRRRLRLLLGPDFEKACKRTRMAAADFLEKARCWSFAFAVDRRVRT